MTVETVDRAADLISLRPDEVLAKLDLSKPGLEAVRRAFEMGDKDQAAVCLLAHYRNTSGTDYR